MRKIRTLFRNSGPVSVILSVVLAVLFVVTAVNAATTISTNINTGGTLTVTGVGHLQDDLNINGADLNLGTGSATTTLTSSGGRIGVASTTPWAQFSVESNNSLTVSGNPIFAVGDYGTTSPFLVVEGNTGKVGIASSSPFVALGITGTTTSSAGAIIGQKGSAVNQILFGSCTLNPGFIQASSTAIVSCTGATNVSPTDKIFITATQLEYGISLVSASSTAVDAISIAVHNNGNASTSGTFGSGIDPISTSVFWMAIK